MDLIEMLTQAQGGQGVSSLGRQFGLDEAQTRAAIEQLASVIAAGLRRNAASDDGLVNIVRELQTGQYSRYAEESPALGLEDATADGNIVLEQIFGSKDVSRGVANQAADLSGIGSALLKKMLPVIAAMIFGSLTKNMSGGAQPPRRQEGGGGLGDILGDVLGGGQPAGRGSQGGGLGDILGDVFGGGQSPGRGSQGGGQSSGQVPRDDAIRRGRESLDDVLGRGSKSGNAADDLLASVERAVRR